MIPEDQPDPDSIEAALVWLGGLLEHEPAGEGGSRAWRLDRQVVGRLLADFRRGQREGRLSLSVHEHPGEGPSTPALLLIGRDGTAVAKLEPPFRPRVGARSRPDSGN